VHGQSAVRAAPRDAECWRVLGEAYAARGSYIASLRAFERSLELLPGQPMCRYSMGRVYQALGQHVEAISAFEALLADTPDFLPAVAALGRSWFTWAKSQVRSLVDSARARTHTHTHTHTRISATTITTYTHNLVFTPWPCRLALKLNVSTAHIPFIPSPTCRCSWLMGSRDRLCSE
jgi:tetratricopeptide (TPR) repeat protein